MSVRKLFGADDLEAIREATARAETRTAGELVTYVVGRCDDYPQARTLGALLGALGGALVAAIAFELNGPWGPGMPLWIALPPVIGSVLGYLAVLAIPLLERALVPTAIAEQRVANRAAAAFLEEEVFATRDRTGILIFLAQFEHKVLVLRDAGINAKVEAACWDGIADDIATGIRERRAADALLSALDTCAALLEEHGVERRSDDRNELGDHVRIRDV